MSGFKNIFTINKDLDVLLEGNQSVNSTVKENREYLISTSVAKELNSYISSGAFDLLDEKFARSAGDEESFDSKDSKFKKDFLERPVSSPMGVRSIFNRFSAVSLAKAGNDPFALSEWRLSNNVPLIDTRIGRKLIRLTSDCSIKNLVEQSLKGRLGKSTYNYSDFMYCKHLGKISNNYLITLRRFPFPVDDMISNIGVTAATLEDPILDNKNAVSVGCMVTWLGTPGNEMSNILKYSYHQPFKEVTSKWEEVNGGGEENVGGKGLENAFNNIAAAFDRNYMAEATRGEAPLPFAETLSKLTGGAIGKSPYSVRELTHHIDANKTYGPVDAIKKTFFRDDQPGLEFDLNITVTFDYELRAYNGINTRQAMLDLLSNILAVTYITGNWWKGGYAFHGAHQNNIFANLNIFKVKGGFNDYVDAFALDYATITSDIRSKITGPDGKIDFSSILSTFKSALNTMGGMMIGGLLNTMGRPAKQWANSLLSGACVGFWHLTVGNPFHPIMSIGNLVLKNATVEHYGPLGIDDFPTGLKVTVELQRGKPRDIRSIESLYMHGSDRIYTPLNGKVIKMFNESEQYRIQKQGELEKPKITHAQDDHTVERFSKVHGDIDNYVSLGGSITDSNSDDKSVFIGKIAKSNTDATKNLTEKDIMDVSLIADLLKESTKQALDKINKNSNNINTNPEDLKKSTELIKKYFGTGDLWSVYQSAREADTGHQDPKPQPEETEKNKSNNTAQDVQQDKKS